MARPFSMSSPTSPAFPQKNCAADGSPKPKLEKSELIDSGIRCRRPGSLNHQPQRERNLAEEGGLRVTKNLVLILRPQNRSKAQGKVRNATDRNPHAKKARQKTRPIHKRR